MTNSQIINKINEFISYCKKTNKIIEEKKFWVLQDYIFDNFSDKYYRDNYDKAMEAINIIDPDKNNNRDLIYSLKEMVNKWKPKEEIMLNF